jgi:hypothetical protein
MGELRRLPTSASAALQDMIEREQTPSRRAT